MTGRAHLGTKMMSVCLPGPDKWLVVIGTHRAVGEHGRGAFEDLVLSVILYFIGAGSGRTANP